MFVWKKKKNKTHECAVMIMSEVEEKTLFECDDFVIQWKVLRIHNTRTRIQVSESELQECSV